MGRQLPRPDQPQSDTPQAPSSRITTARTARPRPAPWQRYMAAATSTAAGTGAVAPVPAEGLTSEQQPGHGRAARAATRSTRAAVRGRRTVRGNQTVQPRERVRRPHDLRLIPAVGASWAAAIAGTRLEGGTDLLAGVGVVVFFGGGFGAIRLSAYWARRVPAVRIPVPAPVRISRRRLRAGPASRCGPASVRSEPVRWPPVRRLSALLICAMVPATCGALVLISVWTGLTARTGGPIGDAISQQLTVTAELVVTTDPRPGTSTAKFSQAPRVVMEAKLVRATAAGRRFDADTPVLVIAGQDYAGLVSSERIRASGTLLPASPGDTMAALFIAKTRPLALARQGPWERGTAALRRDLRDAATRLVPDGGAALLPGMVLGDRQGVDIGLDTAMKQTGLSHLTAVSGSNCGIVLGAAFFLVSLVRLPRWVAAMLALGVLALFVGLVRPDPSVLRAAVMGSVGVLAVLTGRGKQAVPLLCIAVVTLLIIDPWLGTSFAFMLSVAATAGLLFLGEPCARLLGRRLPWPLAVALAIPLTAQLCCAPILILLAPQVAVYAVPANMVAAPVVPAVTLAGLLAVAALVLCPAAAPPLVLVSGWGAQWVASCAGYFAALPGSVLAWPGGGAGALLLAVLSALAVVLVWVLAEHRDRLFGLIWKRASRGRRSLALLASGLVIGLLVSLAVHPGPPLPPAPASWAVANCDVGQGDALVLRTSATSAMVIDTGPEPAPMKGCLDDLGIAAVDLLVITHMHQDHSGGTAGVLDGRTVAGALVSSSTGRLSPDLAALLSGNRVPVSFAAEGQHGNFGPVSWQVWWPLTATNTAGRGGTVPAGGGEPSDADENNASIVLVVAIAQPGGPALTLLLTGDQQEQAARRMLARHRNLAGWRLDVLKVAHHGARNGGTDLLQRLDPAAALISVGRDNDYGHPNTEVIDALHASGVLIGRTDRDGRLYVAKSGSSVLLWHRR